MLVLTQENIAYAAGLFDGEGCVKINKVKQGGRYYYRVEVELGNTHRDVVMWLQEHFGGYVKQRNPRKNHLVLGRKPMWYWYISCRVAGTFLRLIETYSIIKKEQIALALSFYKTVKGKGGFRLRPEDNMVREQMFLSLKALHHLPFSEVAA